MNQGEDFACRTHLVVHMHDSFLFPLQEGQKEKRGPRRLERILVGARESFFTTLTSANKCNKIVNKRGWPKNAEAKWF